MNNRNQDDGMMTPIGGRLKDYDIGNSSTSTSPGNLNLNHSSTRYSEYLSGDSDGSCEWWFCNNKNNGSKPFGKTGFDLTSPTGNGGGGIGSQLRNGGAVRGVSNSTTWGFGGGSFPWSASSSSSPAATTSTKTTTTTFPSHQQQPQQSSWWQWSSPMAPNGNNGDSPDVSQSSTAAMHTTSNAAGPQSQTPVAASDPADVDAQMAKTFLQLSMKERDVAYEEMNGICNVPDENPQIISDALHELDIELNKYSQSNHFSTDATNVDINNLTDRYYYDVAVLQNPTYVRSREFRVMFLRSTGLKAKPAAKRMIMHFIFKAHIFGIHKVGKDKITLDDLSNDDMAAMYAASCLMLPGSDSAGRKVLMMVEKYINVKHWKNQLAIMYYQLMNTIQDQGEESITNQRKGVVTIAYIVGRNLHDMTTNPYSSDLNKLSIFRESLPVREAVVHFCYSSYTLKPFIGLCYHFASFEAKSRFRPVFGSSYQEAHYSLLGVGIRDSNLLVDNNGNHRKYMVMEYMARQRQREGEQGIQGALHGHQPQQQLQVLHESKPAQQKKDYSYRSFANTVSSGAVGGFDYGHENSNLRSANRPILTHRAKLKNPKTETAPSPPTTSMMSTTATDWSSGAYEAKKTLSESSSQYIRASEITRHDILLGRGVPNQNHAGNLFLAKLIKDHSQIHKDAASKFEQTMITWKIVTTVQRDYGGRFLEKVAGSKKKKKKIGKNVPDDDGERWKVVSDDTARYKVAYGFRTASKIQKKGNTINATAVSSSGSSQKGATQQQNEKLQQDENQQRTRPRPYYELTSDDDEHNSVLFSNCYLSNKRAKSST